MNSLREISPSVHSSNSWSEPYEYDKSPSPFREVRRKVLRESLGEIKRKVRSPREKIPLASISCSFDNQDKVGKLV